MTKSRELELLCRAKQIGRELFIVHTSLKSGQNIFERVYQSYERQMTPFEVDIMQSEFNECLERSYRNE